MSQSLRPQHIVVTGIPASGKSILGRRIAEALSLEMLDKDDILEELFKERGVGDSQWRAVLSRAADEILRDRALRSEDSVIVSWWRHPASTVASGTPVDWLSELQGGLIEVHCVCDPVVAVERFTSRTRHIGHLDHLKSFGDLLKQFEEHASLGPVRLGPVMEVNTAGAIDLTGVLAKINSLSFTGTA